MEARPVHEALAGGEGFFGVIVEGRHDCAFEHKADANYRVRMIAGIRARRIGDEEKTRLSTRQTGGGRRLQ